ncbi:aminotransferase class V-fold PLP-dependent enzyme [Clostridium omnivorum]|uniref:Class V aminotransferase n=1 Tax=Clostridium omnivorum TaxID=1604902 RepID=A0ABQ5N485_9CLOT|nr:class V aminotransferase [Clostridium sp. E14]
MNSVTMENNYRDLVIGTDTKIPLSNGKLVPVVNFDNAATTPPFKSVMEELNSFAPWYSSIHRGKGLKSQISSEFYDNARKIIMSFVGANLESDTAIFVKNTTEAINKLSFRLCTNNKRCVILSTNMEHHSNDLPWRDKYRVDYIATNASGKLSLSDLENKLKKYDGFVKLVTVSGASNVTGYINPIYKVAELAHKYNAKILVDGAQLVPHVPVNMNPENYSHHIDYLAFSAHKMYAPFGIGVLIGPKETFKSGPPDYSGGGTVQIVTHQFVSWNDPPDKEEAGSPNLMGVVALAASIATLTNVGMGKIDKYEKQLTRYTLNRLRDIDGVEIYGDSIDCSEKVGIIPFNIDGFHHNTIAEILSYEAAIAVRTGCFCAQPYVQNLLNISEEAMKSYIANPKSPRPGMVRVSFGLYNTLQEIDILLHMLKKITCNKNYYLSKYNNP